MTIIVSAVVAALVAALVGRIVERLNRRDKALERLALGRLVSDAVREIADLDFGESRSPGNPIVAARVATEAYLAGLHREAKMLNEVVVMRLIFVSAKIAAIRDLKTAIPYPSDSELADVRTDVIDALYKIVGAADYRLRVQSTVIGTMFPRSAERVLRWRDNRRLQKRQIDSPGIQRSDRESPAPTISRPR